ncbi:cyclic nucleotide-binding domain protein (macronuclear) [Tetrahymena thermophila SB210]|uniref:Cyclic nucleotide-binding domain protein n=1 Tax=Tetrahymena thermophila (strain SB210) TaxID=312017 RepID=Q235V2_TETTS|nr:cyclic nucleotide-binding domain protein [Tetrahymena thermophila SB210]EAR92309.2 cyclic nucleotide-binding domain protein [Tetrahymena thermophila SB210]|eukprot:XP_001012554.2 cyclic nucleotide-binding domain protein [Tetrahymena thermophila SB210]
MFKQISLLIDILFNNQKQLIFFIFLSNKRLLIVIYIYTSVQVFQMQQSQRKAGFMYREITSDLSLIPKDDYLKVASMILKLDPQDRRDDEIQALQKLTEELQFFKSINSKKVNVRNKLHYKICSKMKYEASQKGQAIIEYGAKADKFFVLLKGSVIVYLTKSAEILQNEIQEEMKFQEEKNIAPLYLTQKEQIRANSISSSQSQSPTNKISFFKSNSILNNQGGGQSSPLTRVNSGLIDSTQAHKKSIVKSHNDSPLNMKLNGSETSEQKDSNKISQNQSQQNGRNSIQIFESININPNDLNQEQANKIQNDQRGDENGLEIFNKSSKKTSQQRFQRMFNLIKQRGNKLENLPQTDDKQLDVTTKENQQEDNAISNDSNQSSQTQIIHKSSMFSKFVNNTTTNNMTGQALQNSQNSDLNSLTQPKINKQLSLSKGFSLYTEDQAKIEQQDIQNEEETHINQIRKRFCEKYMFSKIFGSLNAENIQCPEKLIHFPSFVFKYYYQRTLNQGCTFGELGLLDGKPRSAFILCAEDCEFGIMEKEDYQLLLGNIHRRELERKFNFLKDHMLPELTNQALKKIFYNFQKIKVQKNEYIFRQGTLSEGIYLIKKGDVKLEKTLTYQEQVSSEGENGISMMRKVQTIKKNTPFATLSQGEYFGEEFLIFDFKSKHYRSYSAVASSMKTSLYFMQSSTFTVFLKQFPELFMAFKKSVTFKIERRQEYMENIEQNYKETMKLKEAINNQRQSDLKIIQSLQSQKSYTDLSCASPISQQTSPLRQKNASQQYFIKQLSQQGSYLSCESPKAGQFENQNKINNNERKSLLFYCSPSIKLPNTNNSIADFENIVNSSKSIVVQSSQPQLKFKLISSSQETPSKILSTLHQIDQKQIDEEEDANNKQQKIEVPNSQPPYPQPKLIRLVSTQNSISIPEKNFQQNEKHNEFLTDSNISPIQRSNNQSPTQTIKLQLMSEIIQNEQFNPSLGGQKQPEKKFTRNSQHSKTLSCIVQQSNLLQEQLNSFVYKRDKHKSQTSITHIQPEDLESPLINQKQQTQHNQNKQQVIRQNEFEELEELQDLLDVQYFQTKYNPEKLEELLLQVEKLKAEHKSGSNVIENKLEFLYNRNVKEVKMRINLIKQKIQNAFRKDLSHENQQYQNNRKNIYSNSPNKSVDKITKLSQRYLKKQDQYDKIIRSKITERQKGNSSIQKESNQMNEAIDIQNTVKEIPKIFVNNSDEILKKSSSIDSKYTYLNEKNTIDSVNSNNNLDLLSSQAQTTSIKIEQQNQNQIQLTSSSGFRTYPALTTDENCQSTNKMISSAASYKGASLSPMKSSPNSPKIRPKQRNKSALIHLKLNPSPNNDQFLNFNIINYQSCRQNQDFNAVNDMFQQLQLKTQNSNLIISTDQSQLIPFKTQSSTSEIQVQSNLEHLENYTEQLSQKEKQQTSSKSNFITPNITERRNNTANSIPRQLQKMFLIKSQSNTALTQSQNISPKIQQTNQENNKSSDSQTIFNKKSDELKQSYFFKHRKTQSHLVFDIAPSFQNQKAPYLQQNSSVSPVTKLNNPQNLSQNSLSIKNRYANQGKVSFSLTNFSEIKSSGNQQFNINPNQNINMTETNNNNKILQKSSSYKQIKISQQNSKLKDIVQNNFLPNYTNETQQTPSYPPQQFQQNQNNNNNKYIELNQNMSMINQSQIELIKNNSRLMQRKIHNPLQIFKGSKTNSSITVKSFLDSTNSPLYNNSILKQNFLQQNQQ